MTSDTDAGGGVRAIRRARTVGPPTDFKAMQATRPTAQSAVVAPEPQPLIEASALTKVFGPPGGAERRVFGIPWHARGVGKRSPAVDDVSFQVNRGEFFVIMGLSGSGKSTLLRMLNRLVEPTSGELLIDGRDIAKMSDSELRELRNRQMSMVFQHFALFPHRTIRENAAYGLHVRHVSKAERVERAEWALQRVGLGEWADAQPAELSGGMRQRSVWLVPWPRTPTSCSWTSRSAHSTL